MDNNKKPGSGCLTSIIIFIVIPILETNRGTIREPIKKFDELLATKPFIHLCFFGVHTSKSATQ